MSECKQGRDGECLGQQHDSVYKFKLVRGGGGFKLDILYIRGGKKEPRALLLRSTGLVTIAMESTDHMLYNK
jgi:hypothetical protein